MDWEGSLVGSSFQVMVLILRDKTEDTFDLVLNYETLGESLVMFVLRHLKLFQ